MKSYSRCATPGSALSSTVLKKIMIKRVLAAWALACVASLSYASPYQFTARLYTEALGRAPDPTGWSQDAIYFYFMGCNKTSLRAAAQGVFTSPEYASLGYDNYEKVLTLYRGLFGREPDPAGFAYWVGYLNNGNSMASLVDQFVNALDHGELSTRTICSPRGYGWRAVPVLSNAAIPATGTGTLVGGNPIRNAADLQAALDAAAPGSTVYLSQRTVIVTGKQILVPAGVTLATSGLPGRNQYAKQARIVRAALFGGSGENDGALVRLLPGAHLQGVWVSGQRQELGYSNTAVDVYIKSGIGTSVLDSRLDNPAGWTALAAHRENSICAAVNIERNLVTGYANSHASGYTDGISATCEGARIAGNDIVDPSDVGIVLFVSGPGVTQASQVRDNTVVSAGVPAYGALVMDPLYGPAYPARSSFAGARFEHNVFWAAPDSHFDIGIALGTFTWFAKANVGSGGAATNNTTAGIPTPMQVGIAVDGMVQAKVQGNRLAMSSPVNPTGRRNYFKCPRGGFLADMDVTSHHASGGDMQPYANARVHDCIGHN
jgi:hypothetical protein